MQVGWVFFPKKKKKNEVKEFTLAKNASSADLFSAMFYIWVLPLRIIFNPLLALEMHE